LWSSRAHEIFSRRDIQKIIVCVGALCAMGVALKQPSAQKKIATPQTLTLRKKKALSAGPEYLRTCRFVLNVV